jgi:flavin-dependent dehydrogenase
MYDVIVVGARCAGSTTARLLAQQGHRVLIVDRAQFPSDTISTHCITPGGVTQLKRWGLVDRVLATNVPKVYSFCLTIGPSEVRDPFGVSEEQVTLSPRRTVLDKVLLDAAVEAGADSKEGVTVKDLLRDGARVTGIVGHDDAGVTVEAEAPLVVGADGVHSFVAKTVEAPTYNERPARGSGYYAYFTDFPMDAVELAFNQGNFAGVFPTNDGETCVFAGKDDAEFSSMRDDPDAGHLAVVSTANPRLGEARAGAVRQSRWFAFRTTPGFYRKPYGPGWALVGDAGLHKDPVTGHGITAAFRDAELLAGAIHAGLDGGHLDKELAGYQARRDDLDGELYDATQEIAGLGWNEDSLLEIFLRFGGASMAEVAAITAFG